MEFKVVNLRKDKFHIYLGRAGRGYPGYWGNPVAIGRKCQECGATHRDGGSTLPCYRKYLVRRLLTDSEFRTEFDHLRAIAKAMKEPLVLGCFCKPNPCHGDVMVEFLLGDV